MYLLLILVALYMSRRYLHPLTEHTLWQNVLCNGIRKPIGFPTVLIPLCCRCGCGKPSKMSRGIQSSGPQACLQKGMYVNSAFQKGHDIDVFLYSACWKKHMLVWLSHDKKRGRGPPRVGNSAKSVGEYFCSWVWAWTHGRKWCNTSGEYVSPPGMGLNTIVLFALWSRSGSVFEEYGCTYSRLCSLTFFMSICISGIYYTSNIFLYVILCIRFRGSSHTCLDFPDSNIPPKNGI